MQAQAPLIIVSGPSGSGKSTLIKGVVARSAGRFRLAVSATTRPPRPEDVDGQTYHFWTRERFEKERDEGKFLEHATVHGLHYYGTPRDEVDPWLAKGVGVFLDIDIQGWEKVRKEYPDHLSVFIKLPALWVYCQRLEVERGEPLESIVRRLQTAVGELKRAGEYQHRIINDDKGRATGELTGLIRQRFPGWLPD